MAAGLLMVCTACDDLFEPAIENIKDESTMENEAKYADRILGSSYILLPYSSTPYNDVATDDAVSNESSNAWRSMAGGSWTSQTGVSTDNWRDRNASIQFINIFLDNLERVTFTADETLNQMFTDRMRGEALALRGLNMYYLLQNYGGYGTSGDLLGVHIFTDPFDATVDMNVPRDSFKDCLARIMEDLDEAIELLPDTYRDLSSTNDVPAKYRSIGADVSDYNRVFGSNSHLRMVGRVAAAVRAQAALLAASPAFEASGMTWNEAADYAAVVLDKIGGVAGLAQDGHKWYTAEVVGSASNTEDHPEIIWRDRAGGSSSLEEANFPPSLHGNGRVNPTQNLVDAFPGLNGYPISDSRSGYDANDPYSNRDPRLDLYIVTNGSPLGVSGTIIDTSVHNKVNDNDLDGLNTELERSTRTGYYMRKHLRNDVNYTTSWDNKDHYTKRIRFTEIFLAYAEAANEAWGPTGKGTHGYSAYDVIKAIRERAGIGTSNGDAYLEECKASKEAMRTLIRNERRLELCFENIRFWDLRRWKSNLNEPAYGMRIEGSNYTKFEVDKRNYAEYMYYGPIPYSDILKFSAIEQNAGW